MQFNIKDHELYRINRHFDVTELIKFRHCFGVKGMERILKISIDLFDKKEVQEKHILVDTTVQEKSIIYPTDPKLQKDSNRIYRFQYDEDVIENQAKNHCQLPKFPWNRSTLYENKNLELGKPMGFSGL